MEAADLWCSLDYGKEEVKPGNFGSQRKVSKERQKVLKENPQSLSFVAGDGQTESEETEEEQTEEEEGEVPFRERRMQAWMDKLQEDLGVKIIDEVATEEEESASTEPDDASSSSHEAGVEPISSSEEEAHEEDAKEREGSARSKEENEYAPQEEVGTSHARDWSGLPGRKGRRSTSEGSVSSKESPANTQQMASVGSLHMDLYDFPGCGRSSLAVP